MREHRYHVYIIASRSHTLYIGFTSAIERRVQQHKDGIYDGFSKKYRCDRLVYVELHDDVHRAIAREKQLKRWSRVKKITLIERTNPTWYDLSEEWGKPIELLDATHPPAGLSTPAEMKIKRRS